MPEGSVGIVASTDRAATDVLMGLHGLIDVLVPRGGAGLIRHCVETAKVPVIETGTGNCHVYVHESADFDMAREILVNAKCRRFGVCNACETLLVDVSIAADFLPKALSELADRGVAIHADELACAIRERECEFEGVHDYCVQRLQVQACPSIANAVEGAVEAAGPDGVVCCFGSLYAIADVMAALKSC